MIRDDGLPLGLSFSLATNEDAMNSFAGMTDQEKSQVIEAARSTRSKQEMKNLVDDIARLGSKTK